MTEHTGFTSDAGTNRVSVSSILLRVALILGLVYLFIISITLLGGAFKLFGKGFAEAIFSATSNPMLGLMIGILATAIIQSSSTTTSIIVGLVASGVLPFELTIPMLMGANIGTSVTNTIVSLGHISRGEEFERAFGGAMLHDFFNVCSVIVLLPLELSFGLISKSAHAVEMVFTDFGGLTFASPLKAISKPVATWLIHLTGDSAWLSVILAMILLFVALRYIVKVLKSMVLARVEKFFQRYIFRNPVLSFILGMVITAAVQSSSITTSLVVPLIGAGVITLMQVYPYLLGANVGTTITAFLASFATGSPDAISVAFAHLIFNTYGIAIFWPLKRIPIWMARTIGRLSGKSKLFPILYVLVFFFVIPGVILYFTR